MSHTKTLMAVCAGVAALAGAAGAQETISFPGRLSDAPDTAEWSVAEFSEGCCTMDFNVRRWENGGWRSSSGGGANTADYDWEVPLYAPANGVIISCWRNFPENLAAGETNRHPDFPSKIFSGGNHINILTDEGNVISIAHIRRQTTPVSLCPSNADDTTYPSTMDKRGFWRVGSYIAAADRPRVTEGQFIGRVGNNGQSTGPHLHMDIRKVTGTDGWGREDVGSAFPMKFRDSWAHPFDYNTAESANEWYRLRGGNFSGNPACDEYQEDSPNCLFKLVHPSPYLRRAAASAGAISTGGDTLFVSGNRVVTATIGADNNVKLIGWDLVGVSAINRKGDIDSVAAKQVKLTEPTSGFVLAAIRQTDDRLRMVAFQVTPTGGFLKVGETLLGKIGAYDAATFGGANKKTVTAVRTQSGDMKVIVWDIEVTTGGVSLVRQGEASTGAVSSVAVSRAKVFNGFYTAVRDSAGKLQVIPFKVSTNGATVTRGAAGTAGEISAGDLDVAPLGSGVAAAVRNSDGHLALITWSSSAAGDVGARQDKYTAGAVSEIEMTTMPNGGSNLTTVVRDGDGSMKLIGWKIDANGSNLRRVGFSSTGAASGIAADAVSRSYPGFDPRDMVMTLVRTSSGNLRLISWDGNLVNP